MGIVVVNLMTARAQVGLQVEPRFGTFVEAAAAFRGGRERTAFDQFLAFFSFDPRRQDERAVLRFVTGGLPVSDAADRMTNVTGDTLQGQR
jgi:hypothetical protein